MNGRDARFGLELAMNLIWQEKKKHPVVSDTHFVLLRLWEQLRAEANGEGRIN